MRLSEALAKMRLAPVATEEHVEEAIRIFTVSTVDAINSGNESINYCLITSLFSHIFFFDILTSKPESK